MFDAFLLQQEGNMAKDFFTPPNLFDLLDGPFGFKYVLHLFYNLIIIN